MYYASNIADYGLELATKTCEGVLSDHGFTFDEEYGDYTRGDDVAKIITDDLYVSIDAKDADGNTCEWLEECCDCREPAHMWCQPRMVRTERDEWVIRCSDPDCGREELSSFSPDVLVGEWNEGYGSSVPDEDISPNLFVPWWDTGTGEEYA